MAENDEYLVNMTVTYGAFDGINVNRQWSFSATSVGPDKVVTFSWTNAEDTVEDFDWSAVPDPAFIWGNRRLVLIDFVYDETDRTYTATAFGTNGTGPFEFDANDDGGGGTLPVELSTFTASYSIQGGIQLMWVTQSESDLRGFYIHRSEVQDVSYATVVSALIAGTNTSTMQAYVFSDNEASSGVVYYYWLQSVELDGSESFYGPVTFTYTNNNNGNSDTPVVPGFNSAYPNPFNPSTTINFGVNNSALTTINIYNSRGQVVRKLLSETLARGTYSRQWDGRNNDGASCPSGLYLMKMSIGNNSYSYKLMLMK
ncbi:MAG: FlgD immunoglobulin-like domain containing protein [Candidatus Cloacimonetes bacterium]|nr:FlgD immunoglobulin-like domain containing protein [Candidatus Cloacimonadota bacterium]